MKSIVRITVTNWEKYNPKRAQQTYTWLRLDNSIGTDSKLYGLSAAQKYVWVLILCQASRDNSGCADVNIPQLAHIAEVSPAEIIDTLDHLIEVGIITTADYRELPRAVATPTPTNERTNERTEESEPKTSAPSEPALPSLALIWNEHRGKLPEVKRTNKVRNRKSAQLFNELSPGEWVEIVKRCARSAFCLGANDRGWRADFDWLLQPESHLKIAEGKYDDRAKADADSAMNRAWS
jgi:hypothetical protein